MEIPGEGPLENGTQEAYTRVKTNEKRCHHEVLLVSKSALRYTKPHLFKVIIDRKEEIIGSREAAQREEENHERDPKDHLYEDR